MDLPKRVAPHGSPGRNPNPREMATAPRAVEADENATPRRPVPAARSASPQRKKVLGERNSGDSRGDGASAQPKAAAPSPTPASPTEARTGAGAYDPKTNCTTPRPEFLRYDPKRSAEILLRLEREAAEEEELSGVPSGTEISEPVSSGSSARDSDSECDDEEETLPARGGGWARRLLLLLVSAACLLCYVYCMSSSTPFPASTSEEPLGFVALNGSMHDVRVHEVLSLLGPVDMMGLEHGLEADIGQILQRDSEDVALLRGPGGSPSKFMAVAMMGMADACPNVPFGEYSCQIGDESTENVDVLKEDSEIGDLKSEVVTGGDAVEDSFGSTHSHDTSMEEALVHQEKGEDDSEHSMEKTMESESVKVENDDEELHSLEYGNTAEAAKELVRMVKKLWSALEPHLLKMLACLSVAAAFVTAMLLKYSQRFRKANVPVSKRTPSARPARVPVLAPHSIAQPPVFRSEQPVHRPMPKPEPSSCLELPVQSVLPRPDPPASLNVPSVGHGNRDQRIQQGGDDIVRASDVMGRKDVDKSMPPMVQVLGEFSYVDTGSSRGRPVKDSNQHGGDIRVQESTPPRKDVVRMQKESDKTRSPVIQAAVKKESAAEEEKIDATPTPLRRSSRLRKKTSP